MFGVLVVKAATARKSKVGLVGKPLPDYHLHDMVKLERLLDSNGSLIFCVYESSQRLR